MPHASCRCINNATLAETPRAEHAVAIEASASASASSKAFSILFFMAATCGQRREARAIYDVVALNNNMQLIIVQPWRLLPPAPAPVQPCAWPELPASLPNWLRLLHFRFQLEYTHQGHVGQAKATQEEKEEEEKKKSREEREKTTRP